jgi:hypothetical protein
MQRESELLSLGVCADVSQIPDYIRPENVHVCVVRVSPRQIAGDDISGREKLNAHRRRNVGRATTIPNQGFHRFTTEEEFGEPVSTRKNTLCQDVGPLGLEGELRWLSRRQTKLTM